VTRKITWLSIAVFFGLWVAAILYQADKRFGAVSKASSAVGKTPERIAVYSSAVEEILIAMGEERRIVGTAGFTIYNRQAKRYTNIGGPLDANFERLAHLNPDFIIAQTKSRKMEQFSKDRGIEFMRIDIESIDDVFKLIRALGDRIDQPNKAAALEEKITQALDAARTLSRGKPKVPCFISIDRSPGNMAQMLSTGGSTFVNQMVDIAGGKNIFDDIVTRYPTVSKEALAARAPEVILEFKPSPSPELSVNNALIADWQSMRAIPAVRNGRISVITHDAALTPGPRMGEVIMSIAKALRSPSESISFPSLLSGTK
jgi:iron complex transport system substrate-binding protein